MPASWRHPFLAPLYAGVISFVFVVLFGSVLSQPPQTVIRVVAGGADPLPRELPIEIRNRDGKNEKVSGGKIDNQGRYTPEVPVVNRLVCIQLPALWVFTEPTSKDVMVDPPHSVTCTTPILNQPAEEIVLKLVKGATVRAMADGQPPNNVPAEFAGVLVQIRDPDGAKVTEMDRLDARGRLALRSPVGNRLVCLQPPPGWTVTAPQTTDQQGTKCVKAPGDDVVFTLRQGGG